MPQTCNAVSSFLARTTVILAAVACYVTYSKWMIDTGRDRRTYVEFACIFSLLCFQQGPGFVINILFSFFHDSVHEMGYDPLAWYGVNFQVETVCTMLYMYLIKSWTSEMFFAHVSHGKVATLTLGQYHDEHGTFQISYFWLQFVYVEMAGLAARLFSLVTLTLLNVYTPLTAALASLFFYWDVDCGTYEFFLLYVIPVVFDALTFLVSDVFFRGDTSPPPSPLGE